MDADVNARALIASVELLARPATRTATQLTLSPFDHQRLRVEIDASWPHSRLTQIRAIDQGPSRCAVVEMLRFDLRIG